MIRKTLLSLACALGAAAPALGAGETAPVEDVSFSFEGPFGSYDPQQLQRGLQVFANVCAGCHGLQYLSFRNLMEPGGPDMPEEQVKTFISEYYPETFDPELDDWRASRTSDPFPAVTSANAPDLSLMAKARAGFHGPMGTGINQLFRGIGGPEYIYSLLSGYRDTPDCALDSDIEGSYNIVFGNGGYPDSCKIYEEREVEKTNPDGTVTMVTEKKEIGRMVPGSWISMGQPLWGDDVDYQDGTPATIEQEAKDVAAFLMWAAEPKMMARKEAGLTAVVFLIILSVLLFYTNKKLWAPVKREEH